MSTSTKTQTRSQELTHALATVERELEAARATLGLAVADDNISGAKAARAEVERLEKVASELRAAIPICRQREAQTRREAEEKARRAAEKQSNAQRKERLAQAKRVDDAMRKLGAEYDKLLALHTGGTGDNAAHVIRRKRYSARGAFAHFAPALSRVLEVPVIPNAHRRPLAESERGLITEYPEAE
jgi:septum formation inhibitor MinC